MIADSSNSDSSPPEKNFNLTGNNQIQVVAAVARTEEWRSRF
jgi:hypothetical protein